MLDGKKSKIVRLLQRAIRDQMDVELELVTREVLYGRVYGFELSPFQCIISLENDTNYHVINFANVISFRIGKRQVDSTKSNVAPQS